MLTPAESIYHMFGPDGEFNVKFVSADGYYEAVYNKAGQLLIDENDPINMGTYNYADFRTETLKHGVYDVIPYFKWGNTNPDEVKGLLPDNEAKFKNNPEAVAAYERLAEQLNQHKDAE